MGDIWVLFGATGQQGGAVARALSRDTILSKSISIRAVLRDPSTPAAAALRHIGCETVRADLDDKTSLDGALKGASGIFLVTANSIDEHYYEREFRQGKNVADAAMEAGVQKIIFSTLPSVRKITNDHLTNVVHFDVKYDIEQYIRTLSIASSFIALGTFMQNFTTVLRPQPIGNGTFAIRTSMPSTTVLPLIDTTDSGRVVTQIVKNFDKFRGRTIYVTAQLSTLEEIAAIIGEANSRHVEYCQISSEHFLSPLPKALARDWADFAPYLSDYGYFGPDMTTLPSDEFKELTGFKDFARENVRLSE